MNEVLKQTTDDMKEFMENEFGVEPVVAEDSVYSIMFCIKDDQIIIGASNGIGETAFEAIPIQYKDKDE